MCIPNVLYLINLSLHRHSNGDMCNGTTSCNGIGFDKLYLLMYNFPVFAATESNLHRVLNNKHIYDVFTAEELNREKRIKNQFV